MNHHFPGNLSDTLLQNLNVCFQTHRLKLSGFPISCQIRSSQHMEQVKLHAICSGLSNIPGCFCHHIRCFTRQTQNLMRDDCHIPAPQLFNSLLVNRQIISSSDQCGCFGMDGLQSQFYPHRLSCLQFLQHCQHLRAKAVRTCGNGYCSHIFRINCRQIQFPQPINRTIGVCEGLEVGDIFCLRPGL